LLENTPGLSPTGKPRVRWLLPSPGHNPNGPERCRSAWVQPACAVWHGPVPGGQPLPSVAPSQQDGELL